MENNKTPWRKNLDSRYISGEDLMAGLHDLKPEMVVSIERFNDTDTFDQNTQAKKIATGLFLKEMNGKPVYKPVILNKTNAKFFEKETGSQFMEDWIGVPVVLHAVKDSRHGYVARFKKYVMPNLKAGTTEFTNCYNAIHKNNFTIDQIRKKYQVSSEVEKLLLAKPEEMATTNTAETNG